MLLWSFALSPSLSLFFFSSWDNVILVRCSPGSDSSYRDNSAFLRTRRFIFYKSEKKKISISVIFFCLSLVELIFAFFACSQTGDFIQPEISWFLHFFFEFFGFSRINHYRCWDDSYVYCNNNLNELSELWLLGLTRKAIRVARICLSPP